MRIVITTYMIGALLEHDDGNQIVGIYDSESLYGPSLSGYRKGTYYYDPISIVNTTYTQYKFDTFDLAQNALNLLIDGENIKHELNGVFLKLIERKVIKVEYVASAEFNQSIVPTERIITL